MPQVNYNDVPGRRLSKKKKMPSTINKLAEIYSNCAYKTAESRRSQHNTISSFVFVQIALREKRRKANALPRHKVSCGEECGGMGRGGTGSGGKGQAKGNARTSTTAGRRKQEP